jgi:hypothetical protein
MDVMDDTVFYGNVSGDEEMREIMRSHARAWEREKIDYVCVTLLLMYALLLRFLPSHPWEVLQLR